MAMLNYKQIMTIYCVSGSFDVSEFYAISSSRYCAKYTPPKIVYGLMSKEKGIPLQRYIEIISTESVSNKKNL